VVDFLLVIIEDFLLDIMGERLRANILEVVAFFKGMGQFVPIFHVKCDVFRQLLFMSKSRCN